MIFEYCTIITATSRIDKGILPPGAESYLIDKGILPPGAESYLERGYRGYMGVYKNYRIFS